MGITQKKGTAGGTWAYRVKVGEVEELVSKFVVFPKALNTSLKRAGRKAMTLVLQTMRAKVPKGGKKIKLQRKATLKEAARDLFSKISLTLDAKIRGKKLRKKKAKQYFQKALRAGSTGLLRKSLGSKVGVRRRDGSVYAMAGPRRKRDGCHGKAWSPWLRKMINVIPSKYAHLVERGHVLKIKGKVVKKIPGRPYVRPAYDENVGAIAGMTSKVLQEELDKQWAKSQAAAAKLAAQADTAGVEGEG